VNSSIKTLTLNSCSIADEGCKALAEVLKRNTTITELELNNNMVDYEGCAALAEALANNNALKVSLSRTSSDSLLVDRIPVRSFGSSPALTRRPSCSIVFLSPLVRPQVWKNRNEQLQEASADRRGCVLSQMSQLMGLKDL
jgi:Ran GTPase-activating protein (RanGAP) involved in mRNA processing and transport